jgi:tetratricopeptide (TPR) repeat protein
MPATPQSEDRPTFTPQDMAQAREWFRKGQDMAEKKNYDYAIECYINGLDFWPEAVEEGHKACRAAALFRGPKKVGFGDQMKYKTNVKDPKRAMLNAEMLLSKDPRNVSYMEAVFKNAARAHYDATVMWIGEIFAEFAAREEKPNPARFVVLRQVYEELGDRYTQTDPAVAVVAMQRAVEALSRLQSLKPQDMEISTDLRDVAGKLTIMKGRYASADSFKESMHEGESQRALHDHDRGVQSDARLDELIARAHAEYEANPTEAVAVNSLVELLCRRDNEADETKAIGILLKAFEATEQYRFKMRADDIRMKQLNRKARRIAASGDAEAARAHLKDQLRFELGVFKDRGRHYPTDLRIRYEYGRRLFRAGRFDEAIPVLQEARNDPRTRTRCGVYIGRCFFAKGLYSQAVNILREALASYESPDDDLGKELHWWLGRAHEAAGQIEDALKVYGQLIEWDYNYRNGEVRKRIEDLNKPPENRAGQ